MIPQNLIKIVKEYSSKPWLKALNTDVYIVGGSVRDAYLNKIPKDIDLIIEGLTLNEIKDLLIAYGSVNIVGESFAVIKFKPKNDIEWIDIAVPRTDRKSGSGHKGFEVITDNISIEEDLKRRDFTINSIAINCLSGEILDPFNGIRDIKLKLLKATNPDVFIDDPLRMLRCIQFAARFNFNIEKETLDLIRSNVHLIKEIPGERILEEFNKVFYKKGNFNKFISLINETGLGQLIFNSKGSNKIDLYSKGPSDIISFYFNLGNFMGIDPYEMYVKRLKGDIEIGSALKALDEILKNVTNDRYLIFKRVQSNPLLLKCEVLKESDKGYILDKMNKGIIPSKNSDILVDGNDIMGLLGLKRPDKIIGDVIKELVLGALYERYNWKSEEETLLQTNQILKKLNK